MAPILSMIGCMLPRSSPGSNTRWGRLPPLVPQPPSERGQTHVVLLTARRRRRQAPMPQSTRHPSLLRPQKSGWTLDVLCSPKAPGKYATAYTCLYLVACLVVVALCAAAPLVLSLVACLVGAWTHANLLMGFSTLSALLQRQNEWKPGYDPTLPRNKTIGWWKEKRRSHCANMFYLALFGVASAIFADYTVHTHHGYTIRSLSLQFITFVSSGFAIHEIVWCVCWPSSSTLQHPWPIPIL